MLRTIIQGLLRDGRYALINLTGLSLAMAACMILALYLASELTYDWHHTNRDRIYRASTEWTTKGSTQRTATSAPLLGPMLAQDFTDVQAFVRFSPIGMWETSSDRLIRNRDKAYYWNSLYFADDNVFEVFTHRILHGDPRTALVDPSSAAVSESFATKYFGARNPVGEVLTLENGERRTITLVFADLPANTHLKYDVLFSYNGVAAPQGEVMRARELFAATDYTYLLLPEAYDTSTFRRVATTFFQRYMIGRAREIHVDDWTIQLQPLSDIHLYSDLEIDLPTGNRYYLLGLAAAVVFLLLCACINHVNLATAGAARRAREIGTRKVLGATRRSLAFQFVGESVLLSMAALLVSIAIVELLVPLTPIPQWLGTTAVLSVIRQPVILLAMFAFSAIVGAVAGLYPALYLSSLRPLTSITGGEQLGSSGLRLREALMLVQFMIAACVIACTLVMAGQMRYVADRPLGFDQTGRMVVTLRGTDVISQIPAIEGELTRNQHILGVTSSDAMIGRALPAGFMDIETNEGVMDGVLVNHLPVAHDFIDVLGMQIVAGRNFVADAASDRTGAIIVNEALVRLMGWREPLGKRLGLRGRKVIGVVQDFNFKSLHTPVEPLVIYQNNRNFANIFPDQRAYKQYFLVLNVATGKLADTVDFIGRTLLAFDSQHPFEYRFLDDSLHEQYLSEQRLMRLIGVFSAISIFVACLGLFGLSTFATARRRKEIGIRKVLGASTSQIVMLLSQRTLVLVGLGSLVAWVLAYLAMNEWLGAFAYRIDIDPATFLAASFIVAVVALATVALQSLRAARIRPGTTLRHD